MIDGSTFNFLQGSIPPETSPHSEDRKDTYMYAAAASRQQHKKQAGKSAKSVPMEPAQGR